MLAKTIIYLMIVERLGVDKNSKHSKHSKPSKPLKGYRYVMPRLVLRLSLTFKPLRNLTAPSVCLNCEAVWNESVAYGKLWFGCPRCTVKGFNHKGLTYNWHSQVVDTLADLYTLYEIDCMIAQVYVDWLRKPVGKMSLRERLAKGKS